MDPPGEASSSLVPHVKDAIDRFERTVSQQPEDESEQGTWAANIVADLARLERDVEASVDLSDVRASLSHAAQRVVIRALDAAHDPTTLHSRSPAKLERCCLTWDVTPGAIAFWFRLDHGRPFFDALALLATSHPRWIDALRLARRCSTDRRGGLMVQAGQPRDRGITTQDLNKAAAMDALSPGLPKQLTLQAQSTPARGDKHRASPSDTLSRTPASKRQRLNYSKNPLLVETRDTMVALGFGESLSTDRIGAYVCALDTLDKLNPTFRILDPREALIPTSNHEYGEQQVAPCLPDNLVVLLRLDSDDNWVVVHLKRSSSQIRVYDTAEPTTDQDVIKARIEPWIRARQLADLPATYTLTSLKERRAEASSSVLAIVFATHICTEQTDLSQVEIEKTRQHLQKVLSAAFAQQLGLRNGTSSHALPESDLAADDPSSHNAVARLVDAACPDLRPLLDSVQSTLKHKGEVVSDALKQINEDVVSELGCGLNDLPVTISALDAKVTRESAEDANLEQKQRAAENDIVFFEGVLDRAPASTEETSPGIQHFITETAKGLANARALRDALKVKDQGRRDELHRAKGRLELARACHTLVVDLNATQVYTKQALDNISALV